LLTAKGCPNFAPSNKTTTATTTTTTTAATMAPKARMSSDEKKKVILSLYHNKKEVYTEKEILSLAARAGVNANTILDVNQELVDDAQVTKE
jgi:tryptophan synthase alpha subunit